MRAPAVERVPTSKRVGFTALTLVTHLANFAFVVMAGRFLDPGDFGDLVAILGIVLVGMAPGMAVQALTAAGALGRPVRMDRGLARRLATIIGVVVSLLMLGGWWALALDGPMAVIAIPLAAAMLPLIAVNEGLLQGQGRFLALGSVMAVGALMKLASGALVVVTSGTVGLLACAITFGYLAQLTGSRLAAGDPVPVPRRRDTGTAVPYAVAVMALLLVLVHLDAVIAPAVLSDIQAGHYAVGVTAARVMFWLPQFAILLLYPKLVLDEGPHILGSVAVGVVLLGLLGAAGALVLGEPVVRLVFGSDFAVVGPSLWRWVWLGAAALGMQVLALVDIAHDRRRALPFLGLAVLAVGIGLPVADPATATDAVTVAATGLTALFVAGTASAIRRARSERTGGW